MKWQKTVLANGLEAIAPEIISASRATDIPAFYAEWFFNRLNEGYAEWTNPFNGKSQLVSFANTRLLVFWTKNPRPIMPYLKELNERGINYYFLFTLNNYEKEGYEPQLPEINERICTFIKLSELIGKGRVVWRFDPIFLSDKIDSAEIIKRFKNIGLQIKNFTERMIFSFAEIEEYKKVERNLIREKVKYSLPSKKERTNIAAQLSSNCKTWDILPFACAQKDDYSLLNVQASKCIDGGLISKEFGHDKLLMDFIHPQGNQRTFFDINYSHLKDKGQRKNCGCIKSKDIGVYNTCPHLCVYCYANSSKKSILRNYASHTPKNPRIIPS